MPRLVETIPAEFVDEALAAGWQLIEPMRPGRAEVVMVRAVSGDLSPEDLLREGRFTPARRS